MHGAAVSMARKYREVKPKVDLIVCSDFLDTATFKGLSGCHIPIITYFHENQFAYPWSKTDSDVKDRRDRRYMWINYTSALAADAIWFNSRYNRDSMFNALPGYMQAFPDDRDFQIHTLKEKSSIIPVGLNLPSKPIKSTKPGKEIPILVWNHRWEYDKNPDLFFTTLFEFKQEKVPFKLIVLGSHTHKYPPIFDQVKVELVNNLLHFGPVKGRSEYWEKLQQGNILPVTNNQDFFGISVLEGIAAGLIPLLPYGLAYEEHLNPKKYPSLFYKQKTTFKSCLFNLMTTLQPLDVSSGAYQYSWENILPVYDREVEKLIVQ
jgi:glycosyltransferase involved in cell wall biosynthesis